MIVGDLFAGIGGFSLAARWMGWEHGFHAEVEPYASAVLAKQFPGVPNLGDVRTITKDTAPGVDLLCGGFPCQDISIAGKGEGLAGKRSGLWSEYHRIISELRPKWAVIENVSALRTRGLDTVIADLQQIGYVGQWHCIPASAVGAPHQRDRIWILAWPRERSWVFVGDTDSQRKYLGVDGCGWAGEGAPAPEAAMDTGYASTSVALANALRERLQGLAGTGAGIRERQEAHRPVGEASLCGGGYTPGWWHTEPDVGRVAHGVPKRVDRLRCLGNAIVPAVAYLIFQAIQEVDEL